MRRLIEEDNVDSFNISQYTPSPTEVEVTRIHWNNSSNNNENIINNGAYNVSRCMRVVAEPLLVNQFGPKLMD
ncbi:hypothetical protein H5410_048874 [Solanum commersonii]|uniref:Uncharacterized protein n=1 Tax=Solanum commersonii TaxID=4109 RepID=A0A9J5XMZ9_SOLCO|nr:hypothetical protein H5410_048874 [Solanum commersonii]